MEVDLDLVISTPDNTIDMKSGLTTMQGVSDAVRIIVETVVTNKVHRKNTARSSIRTRLKENFAGSYGQIFGVQGFTDDARKQLGSIGEDVLAELISYYLSEAFYQDFQDLSSDARKIVDSLGIKSDSLIKALRKQTIIENIHNVSNNFDYDIMVRHRKNKSDIYELQKFSKDTYANMAAEESSKIVELEVSITRFNIFTGNGRLQIKGRKDTVAFGFMSYRNLELSTKKLFSRNLDDNNGIIEDNDKMHLKITATFLQKKDGDVVKYVIRDANV